jgi:putative ABC transport system permease protein
VLAVRARRALAWGLQALAALAGAGDARRVPPAGWRPALEAAASGMTVLVAFGIPRCWRCGACRPLRVLRKRRRRRRAVAWAVALLGLAGLGLLLWWKAGSAALGTAMLLGIAATLGALGLLAVGAGPARASPCAGGCRARGATAWPTSPDVPAASVAQIASLGLGLMVLLLLTFVRGDLLARWQQSLPADAPNRFIVNVQPDQVTAVTRALAAAGAPDVALVPMVRARLVGWNGRAVTGADFAARGERARRLSEREFNLSSAAALRADNRVTAGRMWPAFGPATPELSVEQEFADMLGWKVGDRVAFDVAGERLEAKITSLRKVDWESFKPNFFVVASPGVLDDYSASYIGGVHVPDGEALTRSLVRDFPTSPWWTSTRCWRRCAQPISQVSAVVQGVFYFSLAAGVLVLVAAVGASQDERLLEGGGDARARRQPAPAAARAGQRVRPIGILTGLAAAIAASVLAGVVAREVLDLPFTPDWRWSRPARRSACSLRWSPACWRRDASSRRPNGEPARTRLRCGARPTSAAPSLGTTSASTKMPSMAKASASLSAVPIARPTQVRSRSTRPGAVPCRAQFAEHGADEGPEDQPRDAEEDAAHQRADCGADHGQLSGTHALGAHRRRGDCR